jgi:hypothetical protein
MQISHRPTKILVTGKSGTGKSTYFTRYLSNAPQGKVFLFDHEGEYSFRKRIQPCLSMERLSDELEKQYIIYDPSDDFPGDTLEAFNFFCDWTFEVCKGIPGTKLFASDELQKIVATDSLPQEFCCVVETGRRRGIDTFFVCQQPNLLHNRLRNQLTEIVTFAHLDKRALIFLEELGFNADEIRALERGEFRILDLETMRFDGGKFTWGGKQNISEKSIDTSEDATDSQQHVKPDVRASDSIEPPEQKA